MYVIKKKIIRPRRLVFIFIILAVTVYFVYHVLNGNRGILTLFKLSKQKKEIQIEIAELSKEREYLDRKVNMMKSNSIDLDLLDEQVKKNLGYVNKNEKAFVYK